VPPSLPPLFVVPIRNVSTLCTVEQGRLVEVSPIPMPVMAEHALTETGWIAWIDEGGRVIGRTHSDAEPHEQWFPPLSMPKDYQAETLLFRGQVLYAGGSCGREVLGLFDFDEVEPAWVALPVPAQFRRDGKRIDDLLVDGNHLIAVDNIVVPKWLLVYDIGNPRNPALSRVSELPWHTTYEQFHSGRVGAHWLALLSSGVNHGHVSLHVTLLDRTSLQPFGSVSVEAMGSMRHSREDTTGANARTWHDIEWVGDLLLIAAGRHGIGWLDLNLVPRPTQPLRKGEHGWFEGDEDNARFSRECANKLVYHPLSQRPGAAVVRLSAVPGTKQVLVVVKEEQSHDTLLLDLPLADSTGAR
jgi:hypothetical protein